eukprot:9061687-Alexandrium_andersonii.AAC.1
MSSNPAVSIHSDIRTSTCPRVPWMSVNFGKRLVEFRLFADHRALPEDPPNFNYNPPECHPPLATHAP